jgi:Bacterial PH domain
MILHGGIAIVSALIGTFGLWKASTAASGPTFLIYLLITIVAIGFLPLPIYRISALQQGRYILARDGISLYWGLRHEEIPINKVTWVGSTDQNRMVLTKPSFRMPGAVLGVQKQADGQPVEFLAARDTNLVIIVTSERLFAISPANPAEFLTTYRKLAEFGSLAPIQAVSLYPTFLFSRSWADRPARILLISSAVLALGLIIWVSLVIPSHSMTALRLNPEGSAVELVPGIRLLLLPVLNSFFFIADLLLGLFFYRRADTQSLGYLMWASSVMTSLLFLGAVYFILQAT